MIVTPFPSPAAQEGLIQLRDGGGELKEMMDMLLDKGPNVTLAVLKAFTQPDTLAVSCSHGTVCLMHSYLSHRLELINDL